MNNFSSIVGRLVSVRKSLKTVRSLHLCTGLSQKVKTQSAMVSFINDYEFPSPNFETHQSAEKLEKVLQYSRNNISLLKA